MSEFNLSDKIVKTYVKGFDDGYGAGFNYDLKVEDVKEFIRLLKERYHYFGDIRDFIDKLAGDKLNE